MCGICGYATPEDRAPGDRRMLEVMTDLLAHRGPDGEGYHVDEGVGLGIRRLSIVDLEETGDQPIPNEDGTVQVVCNGEIYNAPELRRELVGRGHRFRGHSDTEVIVHLYEELGADCLSRLRGMFGLAVWDHTRRTLLLARDRLGIKPLYYGVGPDRTLYFGSEAKSILVTGAVDRALDPQGLAGLLYFGGAIFDRTLFTGIRQLESGQRLRYHQGRIEVDRYWDLDFDKAVPGGLPRSEGEWAEAVAAKLRESVHIHLRGDVPVAAWLSPGIDSSAVAAFASAELGGLPTLSLGFDEERYDELRHQDTLDQHPEYRLRGERVDFGGHHLRRLPEGVWHREHPTSLQFAYHALGSATRGRYKVVLTGQGSDEVFGGYPWYRTERQWRGLYGLPAPLRRLLAKALPRISETDRRAIAMAPAMSPRRYAGLQWSGFPGLRALLHPDLREAVERAYESDEDFVAPAGFGGWDRFQQMIYVEMKTRMPSYINLGLDAASMAYSVEPRLPFLDHEFVELCVRIPPGLRSRTREKHVLRTAMTPHLPAEIAWRRKRGLQSPDATWHGTWGAPPAFTGELLSPRVVREKGYFDDAAVQTLAPSDGRVSVALAGVLGLHVWDELFVQECRPGRVGYGGPRWGG